MCKLHKSVIGNEAKQNEESLNFLFVVKEAKKGNFVVHPWTPYGINSYFCNEPFAMNELRNEKMKEYTLFSFFHSFIL